MLQLQKFTTAHPKGHSARAGRTQSCCRSQTRRRCAVDCHATAESLNERLDRCRQSCFNVTECFTRVEDTCSAFGLKLSWQFVRHPRRSTLDFTAGDYMARHLISGKILKAPSNKEGWAFGLKIRLNTILERFMRVSLVDSSLEIGVRAVNLEFNLSNATMPDEDWTHDPITNLNLYISRELGVERQGSNSSTASKNTLQEYSGSLNAGKGVGGRVSHALESGENREEKTDVAVKNTTQEKYAYERFAVIATGDEANPSWYLESTLEDKMLRGTVLNSAYFARVVLDGPDPEIQLEAKISPHDVFVRDYSGSFEPVNKRLIALIRIRRSLCKTGFVLDKMQLDSGTIVDAE